MGWHLRASFVAILLLGGGEAQAYPTPIDFDGNLLRWPIEVGDVLRYRVESDLADMSEIHQALVAESAYLWNEIETSYFMLEESTDADAEITVKFVEATG